MFLLVAQKILKKGISAMALWPFILVQNKDFKEDLILINHERIHLRQQIELLIIFFYLWYGIEFLIHLIRFKDFKKAYMNISFEKEAYGKETDLGYLKRRKFWAFIKFL